MRFYKIIVEDDNDVYKWYVCGKNKSDVKKKYQRTLDVCNAHYVSVEDITLDCPLYVPEVIKAMSAYGFGERERQIVESMLYQYDGAMAESF